MTSHTPRFEYPRVLSIAGSDSGGGAGIQADLKTIAALGCFGMTAITALTAQNTCGVRAIHGIPPQMLRDQIDAVIEDIGTDAVKIGMLHAPEIVRSVAEAFDRHSLHCLLRSRDTGEPVGCTRLILARPEAPDDPLPADRIASLWAINGAAAVAGSTIAVIALRVAGAPDTLRVAAALYLLVAIIARLVDAPTDGAG